MANEIDLVVGQAAFKQITDLLVELGKVDLKLTELSTSFSNLGKGAANPADAAALKALTDNNAKLNAEILKLSKSYDDLNKKISEGSNEIVRRSKYTTQEVTDLRLVNKELTLQNTKASELAGAYEKLSAAHKIARQSAADLGAIQGTSSKAFLQAAASANTYDKKLKEIDQQLGNHGRHVGDYSRSWNGLGNSINQLTREAPAFANSIQTGFMALSNNIPILADEINNLTLKNKQLAESGKPTESIFKQVASSFFSWQTLLSLGVTLLTIYGAKLWELATAGTAAEKAQKALAEVNTAAAKDAAKEIGQLDLLYRTANNVSLSIEQRTKAVDKLQELYPSYFKNIKDENILNGQSKNTYLDLRDAIMASARAKAISAKLEESAAGRLEKEHKINTDLEKSRKELIKAQKSTDADADTMISGGTAGTGVVITGRKQRIANAFQDIKKHKQDLANLSADALKEDSFFLKEQEKLDKKSAKLTYDRTHIKEEKVAKIDKPEAEKKVLKFDEVKSEQDLQQAKIQTDKIILQSADLDKMTTEEKIIHREKLTKIELDAIESIRKEGVLVADKKQIDDETANLLALKNQTISREQYLDNIKDINKTHQHVVDKIEVEASNKKRQLNTADLKYQEDLLKKEAENVQKYKINQFESEKAAAKLLSEDNRKNEKLTSTERQSNFEQFKKISKEELASQRDFALSKTVIKTEQDLINQEYAKGIKLLENMSDPLESIKNKTGDWLKGFSQTGLDNPLQAFGMESAKMFLDVKANGETTFSEMYKNAEEGREKFQVAFGAISEVGQGAFNAIAQASMAQYEGEYARLDKQKEISLKFAGDSVAAKEKIEADYAKKKQQIEKKQFEAEKKIRMVNIVMDTAQGVVASLPNIPLSIIVGVLGAVNLAMVATQQFPAYAEGTDNHSGGLMLVNDGAGSNFQEKIILPSGKVIRPQGRNVLMDAPKGTKVLNHEQQLFEMLQSNNISMSNPQYQGMTPDEMDEILGKHFGNIKTQNTIFDKNGFQSYVKNGNSITRSNSNRSQAIGISV